MAGAPRAQGGPWQAREKCGGGWGDRAKSERSGPATICQAFRNTSTMQAATSPQSGGGIRGIHLVDEETSLRW